MLALLRATIGTLTLCALAIAAGTTHAAPPEQPRPACTMPSAVAGAFLILYGSKPAVPGSPPGDLMTIVHFTSPTSYRYTIVGATPWQDGTYTYNRPAVGVDAPPQLTLGQRTGGTPRVDKRPSAPDLSTASINAVHPGSRQTYSLQLTCRTDITGNYRLLTTQPGEAPTKVDTMVYRFVTPARQTSH